MPTKSALVIVTVVPGKVVSSSLDVMRKADDPEDAAVVRVVLPYWVVARAFVGPIS
jgi:hypothetical protein